MMRIAAPVIFICSMVGFIHVPNVLFRASGDCISRSWDGLNSDRRKLRSVSVMHVCVAGRILHLAESKSVILPAQRYPCEFNRHIVFC